MIILNPRRVHLGALQLDEVRAVTIDREPARLALNWTDTGPHATFADVPEQRVTMRIVQDISGAFVDAPKPGESVAVALWTSPAGAEGERRKISAAGVVTGVTHAVSRSGGATRTVELVLVSSDGAADPVSVTVAGGES